MMENPKDFHHDDLPLLERAVDAILRDPIPGDLSPEQVAQLVAVVRQAADRPYPVTLMERIRNMRPRTKIAAVATVLIALVGLMSWLVPGSGLAVAFADVAEALNNVHSATWKTTWVEVGPQNKTMTRSSIGMFLAPSHERRETTAGRIESVSIIDGQKDKAIILDLDQAEKTAMVINYESLPPHYPLPLGGGLGQTFQTLRELVANAQSGGAGKVERLGIERIDGHPAEGFRIEVGIVEVKIWADPKTLLPIRVEQATTVGREVRTVMTDFKVDVDLDKSLFNLDVPAGYTTISRITTMTQPNVSTKPLVGLAETLKWVAEHNNGVYPPALQGEEGIDGIMRHTFVHLEKKHGKYSPEMVKAGADLGPKLAAASAILLHLSPEDDWHYTGKDVKLNTPNQPIFWFKPKKSTKYQVIYADLSIKEVSSEETLKFPPSEGGPKP